MYSMCSKFITGTPEQHQLKSSGYFFVTHSVHRGINPPLNLQTIQAVQAPLPPHPLGNPPLFISFS